VAIDDAVERAQRENEERAQLAKIESSGHLGQQGLLSSVDHGSSPDVSLEVLDADAVVLIRVVRLAADGATAPGRRHVVAQCLVVLDHLRKIAVKDDRETMFVTNPLHSKGMGRNVGQVRIGFRFRVPEAEYFESELVCEALFAKYDTNGDGWLSKREFIRFVNDLHNVGGNVKQLEETGDGGRRFLGSCIPLPDEDLFSYVKHQHTLLVVCFDRPKYLRRHVTSTLTGRLGLVMTSLLWSLSVNCLVTVELASASRFWQVLTIATVDNVGKSCMNMMFLIMHLRCWARSLDSCCCCSAASRDQVRATGPGCCEILPLAAFIVFLGVFSTWLLLAMSPEQLYSSGYSFFPIWAFSRITEIFYWGTFWAFMVQYGSSESAKKTKSYQRAREEGRAAERVRRARLMQSEGGGGGAWWRCFGVGL
jgi:hypothetical protein